MKNTLLSNMHRIPSDTQDTKKKRLELSMLLFVNLNLFVDPFFFFFSENDHESCKPLKLFCFPM